MIQYNNERANRARMFLSHQQCLISSKTVMIRSSNLVESPYTQIGSIFCRRKHLQEIKHKAIMGECVAKQHLVVIYLLKLKVKKE